MVSRFGLAGQTLAAVGFGAHTCYNYCMQDDIKQLLQNYHPSQKTVETLRSQKLIIFAGLGYALYKQVFTNADVKSALNEFTRHG